jgi:RimJ/RimL family protein N-acetyltransferase
VLVLPTFPAPVELHTRRCVLRQWQAGDLAPWAALNADPEVRRYFPSLLTPELAEAEAGRCRDAIAQRGWGIWALDLPGVMPFAGLVGMNVPRITTRPSCLPSRSAGACPAPRGAAVTPPRRGAGGARICLHSA